jgi:prepilin-type N-terminal cleavage/methylation domain-containing protein
MARRRNRAGFTLVEMLTVVTIIAVLAVVAGTAYRRYMDSARTSEAYAMLGELRAKEEAYRAEFSSYTGWSGGSELASASQPAVNSAACNNGSTREPCPKAIPTTNVYWNSLGINPGRNALQCGYILNSGDGTTNPTGAIGQGLLGSAPVKQLWWYAVAICNNDGNGPTDATFATASSTTVVSAQNEHQ